MYGSQEWPCLQLFFLMPLSQDHKLIITLTFCFFCDNRLTISLSRDNKALFPLITYVYLQFVYTQVCRLCGDVVVIVHVQWDGLASLTANRMD